MPKIDRHLTNQGYLQSERIRVQNESGGAKSKGM